MTYSVTTPQDVAWFWSRFRDMDWHELVLAGKHELSPDEFVNLHTELYTASKDGTPIAMFGVNEGANEMYVTCLGTNEMMKYMVKLTRGSRGFLEFRAELYSPKPLVVAVYEHNYASKRWLRMLGFKYSGWDIGQLELMRWYPMKESKECVLQ